MRTMPILIPLICTAAIGTAEAQPFTSYETRGIGTRTDDDSDGDGLTDEQEPIWNLIPALADTDGDALLDGWEVMG